MLRTSTSFHSDWVHFVRAAVKRTPSPIFYQHVTHEVFKTLVKLEYPCVEGGSDAAVKSICREEENVLRYVAGYVCRKLRNKIEKSSLPNKDDLVLCLLDMSGDDDREEDGTEDWLNAIDRGGLWHVSDQTYGLFYVVEEVVRKHFTRTNAHKLTDTSKHSLIRAINENEDVMFQWCIMTAGAKDGDATLLLHMIVELYITLRGFSFAASFIEQYKKATKRVLQKGKGIRKELFTSNV